MARFAAIDIGSNALRLRVVEASRSSRHASEQLTLLPGERDPGWSEIVSLRAAVRLGGEVFVSGKLAPASIAAACAALKEFRQQMDAAKVDAYRATATSAVREAANGATFIERVRREAGIELEAIEGIEEARLIQLAVTRRIALDERKALLIDVGGGSTELTLLDRGQATFAISLPVGTVRILETFLREQPIVDKERADLIREAIDRAYGEARPHLKSVALDAVIGTGGNLDTLAELCPVKGGKTNERAVDLVATRALFAKMCAMAPAERAKAYGLRPDRADTIVPAAAIFLRLAELLKAETIVAPGVGLKDGILEELVDKHFHVWDTAREAESVLSACVRLGHRYHFDEKHGLLVAHLATRLFDDLRDTHALTDRDRLLLRAAALLHDIGDFVRYDGHHKHSYYVILHSDIMGLTPAERNVVANVARYHRKSGPDPSHPNFRELDKDTRSKVRALAAILRVADGLDREHLGKVTDVRASLEKGKSRVALAITGSEERELEEWTVRAKSGLWKDVFGLDVVLTGA